MHVKRLTLTSKKNWWMVEVDEPEEKIESPTSTKSFSSSEETAVNHDDSLFKHRIGDKENNDTSPNPSIPIFRPPRHPTSIFSFPTPTAYAAPPNPTSHLAPVAQGSASELFKCVVKKPEVVQLEINGEMQTNAFDVTTQFLAELRVYTTVSRHRNICAFLGSLENVGMVLEYIDGRTLYDVIKVRPTLERAKKIDFHNQLLDGMTHLHSYGLSHGDLSLLNIQVTSPSDTVKLLDFGRSVSMDSTFTSPDGDPVDPFAHLGRKPGSRTMTRLATKQVEQIHPGTRPFAAPEVLRGECQDPILADAYSFGMILVSIDRCETVDVKPWDQRKDKIPASLFDGCEVFEERAKKYLAKWNTRRRLMREDLMNGQA
ncbi:kinase-like protein [Coniophora puteana RWD-64-598 SS2]|uniref:Kinase-like protein n=1 Tax=Coniophora puteana (strain RWD-64-598) TaxID=741705 RepID=A0A5M3MUI0_CONPW|nr:kinase-like protein [Coniophora puteana RWD-64-598 SS2]EIW82832.1 kinase-like protein [Coniophora puteana RWD-64-598 SS2]